MLRYVFIALVLVSCGTRNQEEFQTEGQKVAQAITRELQQVHTRDDFSEAMPRLKKLHEQLVDVIISAKQYRQMHGWEEVPPLSREAEQVNVRLQVEVARVSRLEGGQEFVERCQESALNRLDAFLKQSTKSRLLPGVPK